MTASLITFYSFKGGVGRTQALANVAVALARRGYRVIAVDMDFESPGLHAFFGPGSGQSWTRDELSRITGLLEFLEEAISVPDEEPDITRYLQPCVHSQIEEGRGSLRLLLPGRLDEQYGKKIAGFSWDNFYRDSYGYELMEMLRDQLVGAEADYVLVDSRTGMTDVAGICTFQLPDIVVALFALHRQGIDGVHQVARAIERTRAKMDKPGRPNKIVLVPARVEEGGEIHMREQWVREMHHAMQDLQGELFDLWGNLHQRIPYEPRVAFGEQVVVGGEPSYLSDAYEALTQRLLAWTGRAEVVPATRESSPRERSREAALRIRRHAATITEVAAKLEKELEVLRHMLGPRLGELNKELPMLWQHSPRTLEDCRNLQRDTVGIMEEHWSYWHDAWLESFASDLQRVAKDHVDLLEPHLDAIEAALDKGDLDLARARQAQALEQIRIALEQRRERILQQPQSREELMQLKRSIDEIVNELLLDESLAGEAERLSTNSARALRDGNMEEMQRILAGAMRLAPEKAGK